MKPETKKPGKVITFYSYKGGVGRSMALANIGVLLSNWGYKTLMIDWDLEAPGLENFFENFIELEEAKHKPGLIDILNGATESSVEKTTWRNCLLPISMEIESLNIRISDQLHLITSGRLDDSYYDKVRAFDFNEFYKRYDGGNIIEEFRCEWKQEYDYILIDSRTGVTDIGGVCTIQLPDLLVLLFTPTKQGFTGIRRVAKKAIEGRKQLPYDRVKLLTLPIPTRMDNSETGPHSEWMATFAAGLEEMYSTWLPNQEKVNRHDFLLATKIPYIAFFSFGEGLPVAVESARDTTRMGYAYETVAALVALHLNRAGSLITNRDIYVSAAKDRNFDLEILTGTEAIKDAHENLRKKEESIQEDREILRKQREELEQTQFEADKKRRKERIRLYFYATISIITIIIGITLAYNSVRRQSQAELQIARLKKTIKQQQGLTNIKRQIVLQPDSFGRFSPLVANGKPIGIDLSHLNHVYDWSKAKASGISFVFIKATEGEFHRDTTFATNWKNAKQYELIRGAYLYFSYTSPAAAQAENFISLVTLDNGDLPPTLDLGVFAGAVKIDPVRIQSVREVLSLLEQHYNVKPIIYCPYTVAAVLGKEPNFHRYVLWISLCGQNNIASSSKLLTMPYLPTGWKSWAFWQFTTEGSLSGIENRGARLDLNQFNGSISALQSLTLNNY